MATVRIPRKLVEFILLGPIDDRRQLQETPILGDVWIAFADKPEQPQDLLIGPYQTQPAGLVAADLACRLEMRRGKAPEADIAYLQGIVAARLTLSDVLLHVLPMTHWWRAERIEGGLLDGYDAGRIAHIVDYLIETAQVLIDAPRSASRRKPETGTVLTSRERLIALAGIIHWASTGPSSRSRSSRVPSPAEALGKLLGQIRGDAVAERLLALDWTNIRLPSPDDAALVWQVSLNRRAVPALEKSIPAVKADAARTLFNVSCKEIVWAVVDSGIDAKHPVFQDGVGNSRVKDSYDFSKIRQIISLDNLNEMTRRKRVAELLNESLANPPTADEAVAHLKELAEDARKNRPVHWGQVEKFVKLKTDTPPRSEHGTHVAGIIGADQGKAEERGFQSGMCPDIRLIDLRVLARTEADTEFSVIAALQFLRHLNERNRFMSVHGVNLSLSIPHDVRNYACGRTPVCEECERLVDSGIVVVAAAGNHGYKSFETLDGSFDSYAAFSITDPGNAEGVITVGATHRHWPHTYGVSFFSSRGPTGDGRMKPDLVAPGERIEGPLPEANWGQMDGTSMAAPHVSGAAAMLMARYSELIGRPRRIKEIICNSATDLGRERSFQGHGMLDVLRAFQSV
ncbi:S8 family peptidase [Azospirillum sp. Sh1]|uniref:S8 family peptidase n=1 Tax=Azospirillum sp. Sh1 TaxID=2607285 RepID=UPI0011EECC53|nr:S8 family peptidase [Azospirillum sp. Sh1]KAA0570265.1 S8 family peptidase [Azospirillum sp. Sh1]